MDRRTFLKAVGGVAAGGLVAYSRVESKKGAMGGPTLTYSQLVDKLDKAIAKSLGAPRGYPQVDQVLEAMRREAWWKATMRQDYPVHFTSHPPMRRKISYYM